MKHLIIFLIAYFYANQVALCQDDDGELQRLEGISHDKSRVSMLSMLSKFVELNGTFIDESMKGSMTEGYGGVWLNATRKPKLTPTGVSGLCEIEETYEEEETIIEKIPFEVEVEVWCWSIRCTEMETRYREEKRKQNVTKTRKTPQCCENYEQVPDTEEMECRPICNHPCENYGFCVQPDTCKCDYGYEGKYCEIDTLPEGVLNGPNVCERDEMREEVVRVVEQQLVPKEYSVWCWPQVRCSKTKMENQPVEKVQKMIKAIQIKYCCDGYVQNFMGNRCISVETVEGTQSQQQAVVH